MTMVVFTKIAAGPTFGPYNVDDVVDLNATDLAHVTGPTEPEGRGKPAAVQLQANDSRYGKPNKKGT
jgi:hypothetical protein